jgi:hypothetical protein
MKQEVEKKEIGTEREDFDSYPIWQNNAKGDWRHKEVCPDCGESLRIDGRCRFCACCGWSTCA